MDLKTVAKNTAKVLISYLTYQAVRTVESQLRETNPSLSIWLNQFSSTGAIQDGEAYLEKLLKENAQLAFRIMTVRQHLADEIADFLPEMVKTGIQQANMDYRRHHLERITQLELSPPASSEAEPTQSLETGSEPDVDHSSS